MSFPSCEFFFFNIIITDDDEYGDEEYTVTTLFFYCLCQLIQWTSTDQMDWLTRTHEEAHRSQFGGDVVLSSKNHVLTLCLGVS